MRRSLRLGCLAVLFAASNAPAYASPLFSLTFDPSTTTAPAGFFTGIAREFGIYESLFTDSITINLHVGWGDIDGAPLNPGNIGQSLTNQAAFPYDTVRAALVNDAKSPDDAIAVASLPLGNPTPGRNIVMSSAEAKALGLLPGNAPGIDGWVGFNKNVTYTFDPNERSVPGAYDFLGVVDHELTEVMGRYGFGQNGGGSRDSPIDLFRYFSTGSLDLSPAFGGPANYFSIDGGVTSINFFNTVCCGDLSDWAGLTPDAYNAFVTLGRAAPTTSADLEVMDAIGYDRALVPTPEPTSLVLVSTGVFATMATRRARRLRPKQGDIQ